MNLEIDRIEKILKQVEAMPYEGKKLYSETSGDDYEADMAAIERFKILAYHYQKLEEAGFVNCEFAEASVGGGIFPTEIRVKSLTYDGHKLLETLHNETLLAKIKAAGKTITIDVLKEMPALALQYLLALPPK